LFDAPAQEDALLQKLVESQGPRNWTLVAEARAARRRGVRRGARAGR